MGDKTDCFDYLGIMLLSNTYKILTNILLSRLPTCATNKIIGAISVNFNIKDGTTAHTLSIHQVLEKKRL